LFQILKVPNPNLFKLGFFLARPQGPGFSLQVLTKSAIFHNPKRASFGRFFGFIKSAFFFRAFRYNPSRKL
jgi:hypothetical protein